MAAYSGPKTFFHIAAKKDWLAAKKSGSYRAESLKTEGFIHCSTAGELIETANAYFKGRKDLVLLSIRAEKLQAPLKFELAPGRNAFFPHIYGPLNAEAVAAEQDFPPRPDGTFELPAAIASKS